MGNEQRDFWGEQLEIRSDNGNKGAKTGEQWKYEPWDPQDWWHRPKLGFLQGGGGGHSARSLPLRIPPGDLVKLTRCTRDDRSAALCADLNGHLLLAKSSSS